MEISVIYPSLQKDKEEIAKRMANFHAEIANRLIQELDCPIDQKFELLSAVMGKGQGKTK